LAAGLEGNVDREHPRTPVGEPGCHAAVGTHQRAQTWEGLTGSRAGLAGQGNPQPEALGVPASVAQAAAFHQEKPCRQDASPVRRPCRPAAAGNKTSRAPAAAAASNGASDPAPAQIATPNLTSASSKTTDPAAVPPPADYRKAGYVAITTKRAADMSTPGAA
jgi:hypothetical protein